MRDVLTILGGSPTGREIEPGYEPEVALNSVLGDRIREDDDLACDVWAALANIEWIGPDGRAWGYSFRAAGDAIAAIRNETGDMPYMRWYCSAVDGIVTDEISDAMLSVGWKWRKA